MIRTEIGPQPDRAALGESEECFHRLVDAVSDYAIFMLDAGGHVMTWNRGAHRIKGYSEAEIVGRHFSIFYTPEMVAHGHPERELRLARADGRYEEEGLRVRKDGSRFWAQVTITPVFHPDGGLRGFAKVTRDITERRHGEAALRESEARFRQLTEALRSTFILRSIEPAEVLYVSPSVSEMFGLSLEQAYADPTAIQALIHPDDRDRMDERRQTFGAPIDLEFRIVRPDGEVRWIRSEVAGVRDEAGRLTRIAATNADVTEERETRERFRLLAENSSDMIARFHRDERALYVSPACRRLLGYEPAELVGRSARELIHPDDLHALLEPAPPSGNRESFRLIEVRVRRQDGSYIWTEWNLRRMLDPVSGDVTETQAAIRDITDRRRLLAVLALARDKALEAARLKSEFLARMSHEIRTPMNGVVGMASLLLETELDHEQVGFAQTMRTSAEALRAVIDDILDFSKIEAGRLELEEIDFDLAALVEEVTALLAGAAQAKQLELAVSLDPELPAVMRGDPVRVRQVLINLVGNAVKFTEQGHVIVSATVLECDAETVSVRLAVRDSGIGIPAAAQAGLFESFTQADASTTRRFGGSGLGLAISKRLVEMMRGEIGFESAPGVGSRFWFALTVPRGRRSPGPRHNWLEGRRVLVVDDLEANRTSLARQLEDWGMSPGAAGSAEQALAAVHAAVEAGEPFEIVVSDLRLPGRDGVDLAGALARLYPSPPVILLSSDGGRELVRDRLGGNVTALIMKPPRGSQLQDALATALGAAAAGVAAETDAEAPARGPGGAWLGHGHALVVDDVAVNRQVAAAMLARSGYAVEEAVNGEEALAAFERGGVDVILMDCEMPVLDGYATAAEIRRREGDGPRTAIVGLTASAMRGDAERALAAGMDVHLPKPIAIEQLQVALSAARSGTATTVPAAVGTVADGQPLDMSSLERLRRLDGDGHALREFINLFLADSPSHLEALAVAARGADPAEAARAGHALMGSSALAGAHRLVAMLKEIESAARDGALPNAAQLARVDEAYQEATAALLRARDF